MARAGAETIQHHSTEEWPEGNHGNKNPDYNAGGQTHTDGFGSIAHGGRSTWAKRSGRKIEVYNRKGFESRLNGFTVTLMGVLRGFRNKKIRAERIVINLKTRSASEITFKARRKSHRRLVHPLPKSKFPRLPRSIALTFKKEYRGHLERRIGGPHAARRMDRNSPASELKVGNILRNMSLSGTTRHLSRSGLPRWANTSTSKRA